MAGRRLLYLTALGGCFVFYIAYGQWLSWIILLMVLGLPWFSLLLSLPAILCFRAAASGPASMEIGEEAELWLMGSCSFPMPPFRGKLRLKNCITGRQWFYQESGDLPTDHCGGISVTADSVRVCDYLGLFSFPVRCREKKTILIRPKPVGTEPEEDLLQHIAKSFRPKSGGGYAENHELRTYRPGDSLNQIHWKLSAKTDSLIIRQPMEPQPGLILLTLNHRGTGDEIDRKLGRLLSLGQYLLEQQLRFEIRALTGDGIVSFAVCCEQDLQKAVDSLLCSRSAEDGDLRSWEFTASWHCHIGGEPDDA